MGFLYGDIKQHIPRTNFTFSAIYKSRAELEEDYNKEYPTVGESLIPQYQVAVNEYVLIDYSKGDGYQVNKAADNNYGTDYHYTVWQKQRVSNNENPRYVAIARLHNILPTFEVKGSYIVENLMPLSADGAFGVIKAFTIQPSSETI